MTIPKRVEKTPSATRPCAPKTTTSSPTSAPRAPPDLPTPQVTTRVEKTPRVLLRRHPQTRTIHQSRISSPTPRRRPPRRRKLETLLAGISDEDLKAKAKLLADAAIAGLTVQEISMTLTAESGDVACAQAFSKMQLDASLGACDAAVSTSRRRRLVAETAYVTVLVSPLTVDETEFEAALANLSDEGVTATWSNRDPIEELTAIPEIDASSLATFEADAEEAAEAMSAAEEVEEEASLATAETSSASRLEISIAASVVVLVTVLACATA